MTPHSGSELRILNALTRPLSIQVSGCGVELPADDSDSFAYV